MDWIESFLFSTIWGVALLASPLFAIAWVFNKLLKGSETPYYIAGGLAILMNVTVPSIPRILFEKRILEQTRDAPGFRLIDTYVLGDFAEPLTWFYDFHGYFRFIRPESPYFVVFETPVFREIIFRYGEEPKIFLVEVHCDTKNVSVSAPGDDGVFYLLGDDWGKLDSKQHTIYCERDWTEAAEELRQAYLDYHKGNPTNPNQEPANPKNIDPFQIAG